MAVICLHVWLSDPMVTPAVFEATLGLNSSSDTWLAVGLYYSY